MVSIFDLRRSLDITKLYKTSVKFLYVNPDDYDGAVF